MAHVEALRLSQTIRITLKKDELDDFVEMLLIPASYEAARRELQEGLYSAWIELES